MKTINDRAFEALQNIDIKRVLNQNILTFDFGTYMSIAKELATIFENEEMRTLRCSYVNTKFEYASDIYETKPLISNIHIPKDVEALENITHIEFNSLYPAIFAKAFKTGELDVEINHFNKLFVWLVQNRAWVKQQNDYNAYYVLKYIINAFYGILSSKKRILRSTSKECIITKFFERFVLPHIYDIGLIYWNVDEFIVDHEFMSYQVSIMLNDILKHNEFLSYERKDYKSYYIEDNQRMRRILNRTK